MSRMTIVTSGVDETFGADHRWQLNKLVEVVKVSTFRIGPHRA